MIFAEAYPKGTTDFTAILSRVRASNVDVLAAATYFEDAVAISRQLRAQRKPEDVRGDNRWGLPKFHEVLGQTAEFVYVPSPWEPELVTLRAGGLIPVARQYPGAKEFVERTGRSSRAPISRTTMQWATAAVRSWWRP